MTIADVRQKRDDLLAENNALAVELADALAEVTRLRAALLKVYECDGCRHCSDLTGTALDALAAGRGWTRSRTVTELVDAARRHDDGQR